MNIKPFVLGLLVLAGVQSGSAQAALPASYSFTFLESLGGPAEPFSINNASVIAGTSRTDNQATALLPVMWENNNITNLGIPGTNSGAAYRINNNGQIAGYTALPGSFSSYAAIWNNQTPTILDPLHAQGSSQAWGINDLGQAVGWSTSLIPATPVPTIWNGTTPTQLPTLGATPEGEARSINNSGQITGLSNLGTSDIANFHAVLWQNGSVRDIGTLGGNFGIGQSNNEAGQIVGTSSLGDSGPEHGFLWENGQMIDLGALGSPTNFSEAWDINNRGQIVGSSELGIGLINATIWDNGQIYNLNSFLDASAVQAGWVLAGALSINDQGQIVGNAFNSQLRLQGGFLLTPTPVPEPETYAMLIAGLGFMGFVSRRRRPRVIHS